MKFSKVSLFSVLAVVSTPVVQAVTREECKADYLPGVLECYDAATGVPDCDLLPIPDFAMPQNQANEMGYWLQHLRDTPTSHAFALSENAYSSLILVDLPPTEEVGKRTRYLKGGNSKRSLQDEEEDLMFEEGPSEMSSDMPLPEGITIGLVDFPPTFQQFDDQGNDAGSHIISAIGDILDMVGATMDDIGRIEMIYTHGHKDHIGLANHTYTYITETMGMDPAIIATDGVKHHFEHAIEKGYYTYYAPLPTVTFAGSKNHTVGYATELNMKTFDGHQYGDKDVIVFMEALDEENPAIMMVVDVVFPKWVPFFSFALTTDLLEYVAAHELLLEYPLGDDGYLVGGHLNQVGDRNDIILNEDLTKAIIDAGKLALETVDLFSAVGPTGAFTPGAPNFGNSWAGFGAYFDELARVCAKAVLEEYGCDFGGLDVTLHSHCIMAQSFWRLDV